MVLPVSCIEGIRSLSVPAPLSNFSSKNFYRNDGHLFKQIWQHNLRMHGTESDIMHGAEDKDPFKTNSTYAYRDNPDPWRRYDKLLWLCSNSEYL